MNPYHSYQLLESVQNPKVRHAFDLRERRERDKASQFLIEGYRELFRAVVGGFSVAQLFFCPELFLGENEEALIEKIKKNCKEIYRLSEKAFRKISYRDRPDGLLAIAPMASLDLSTLEKKSIGKNPFYIIAEAIEKPGNLGTILRSADAVGATGLVLADKCTDLFNPNVVRASVGTLFTVPVAESGSDEALLWLKKNNIKILAATPSAEVEYTDVDLTGPVAVAVGTEQLGLSKKWMERADLQVKIPMMGVADSLNVATATTVLLYEVLRQRRAVPRP